jgi:hypothetical protein
MSYTTADLDAFESLFDRAALDLTEDDYFSLILTMDPDRSIEDALQDRRDVAENARRAALTDEQRADEDAHMAKMVTRGMEIVRAIMERQRG